MRKSKINSYLSINTMVTMLFFLLMTTFNRNAVGQTYTSIPVKDSWTATTNLDVNCSTYTSHGQNELKMGVSINGNEATFLIAKNDLSKFTKNGTGYIKKDDACGTILGQINYSVDSYFVIIKITLSHTSGTLKYCGMTKTENDWRNHTNPVSISAINLAPTIPSNPSPSIGATGVSTSPGLSWSCSDPEGGSVGFDLYIGTSSTNLTLNSSGTGTSKTLSGLASGQKYYWKIAASDNQNNFTQGPVWSFTTRSANQAPTTPSNPSPSSGTTGVSSSPTLSWSSTDPEGGSVGFDLYFGTSSTNLTLNSSGTGTSKTLSALASGQKYYWKIAASDNQNNFTQGPVWSFTTQSANQAPTIPSNPSPGSGSTGVSTSPSLSWSCSDPEGGSVGFDLYIGTSSTNLTLNSSGTGTSKTLSALASGQKYYWKIAASDNQNNFTQGPIWSFTTTIQQSCSTYSDCPSSTDCDTDLGLPTEELYNAVQYLCLNKIIDNDNFAGVNDDLKRQQLAKMAFLALFNGDEPAANTLASDNCLSPYLDLQDKSMYYYRYAKALLFLEYDNGISPFSRDFVWFNPEGNIQRLSVLKLLLETFDIAPASSGSNFIDLLSTAENYGYARKAYDLGIITAPSNSVYPERYCTRGELFVMLTRLMQLIDNGTIDRPSSQKINNGFYLTGFISPKTISSSKGFETGNFNHYSKSSFMIPGRNLSMNFEHMYNSYLTTLPSAFFPVQPLGNGWSHTYNSFITLIQGETSADNRWFISWPDGSVHVYYKSGSTYDCESNGIYDKLTETVTGTKFELRKKNQVVFTFEKIGSYNSAYLLTSVRDRNNNTITITYETANNAPRIQYVLDDLGRKLFFTYKSGTNLIQTVIDPLNRVIVFNYTNDKLSSFTDAKSLVTAYQYGTRFDEQYLLTQITLPKGNVITNTYFQQKLKSSEIVGASNSSTEIQLDQNYSAGGNNFMTSTVTSQSGNSATITENYQFNSNGMVTSMTDNQVSDVSAEYNNVDFPNIPTKITNEQTNALLEISNVDKSGNVRSITRKADGKTYTTTMTYTDLNDIATITDARSYTTTYAYSNGNLSRVTDPMGSQTNILYNLYGQTTSLTNPLSIQTTFEYDGTTGQMNRMRIPALGLSATSSYDLASRKTSSINFKSQESKFEYDKNDNLTKTTKVGAHNGQDVVTTHTFDNNDNLNSIVNALNRTTVFSFDNTTDWLLSESFEGATKRYSYFSDGSLKTFTNPNGEVFNYVYDNLGRVIDNGYASYGFDSNSGKLSEIEKDGKAVGLEYDGFNRIESATYDGKTVSYVYDAVDNLTAITYPGGKTVKYSYNANNQLMAVKDWNDKETLYNYNNAGQLTRTTYPNGVVTTYLYDNAGRQTALQTKRADNTIIADYTFTLDDLGNHLTEAVNEPFTTMPSIDTETINYTYNNANRIQTAGNIAFDFEANGNTIQKGASNMSYDKANNLLSVSGELSASYTYDGMGMRRKAIRNGITTKYVMNILGMGNILMETDDGGTAQNYYVYGLGLISRISGDNSTSNYYVYDYRGSTIAITDDTQAANITHQYQYDDFGKVLQAEEADLNRFRYVGKYGVMYENDELVFMRARYYDPTIGRFLSEDPIWSTNLYPYADNNPINNIDPEGEFSTKIVNKGLSSVNEKLSILEFSLAVFQGTDKLKSIPILGNLGPSLSLVNIITDGFDKSKSKLERIDNAAGGAISLSVSITVITVGTAFGAAASPIAATAYIAGNAANDIFLMATSKNMYQAADRLDKSGSVIYNGGQKVGNGLDNMWQGTWDVSQTIGDRFDNIWESLLGGKK